MYEFITDIGYYFPHLPPPHNEIKILRLVTSRIYIDKNKHIESEGQYKFLIMFHSKTRI